MPGEICRETENVSDRQSSNNNRESRAWADCAKHTYDPKQTKYSWSATKTNSDDKYNKAGDPSPSYLDMSPPDYSSWTGAKSATYGQQKSDEKRSLREQLDMDKPVFKPEAPRMNTVIIEKVLSPADLIKQKETLEKYRELIKKETETTVRELSANTKSEIKELATRFGSRDGVNAKRAHEFQDNLNAAADRIKDNPYIQDPSKELERMVGAMNSVLSSDGKIDGKQIHSKEDHNLIVEGMARRSANPVENVNQGLHATSPMELKAQQILDSTPAAYCETVASIATTGKAAFSEKSATKVHTDSLRLDDEARKSGVDKRDASGQLFDLATGQAYWDTQAGPDGRYEYRQAAHPAKGESGESLVKIAPSGSEEIIARSAMFNAERTARMSRLLDAANSETLYKTDY